MSDRAYMTVVETRPFIEDATRCLPDDERQKFIGYIARSPTAGVLIPGTGGVRKIRWGTTGKGKRGGVRIIYYYHSEGIPLFLLTVYAKSQQSDLSSAERAAMRRIAAQIVKQYANAVKLHSRR